MIKNYIKIAWRNLWKNKLFSLINIISLAIGLSASFVIGMMVYYDFSFDKFHPDGDRIYRITSDFFSPEGNSHFRGVTAPLADALKQGTTGVETVNSFFTYEPLNVEIDKTSRTFKDPEFVVLTDENYFKIFDYNWLAGTKEAALDDPNEVVLTESRAKKYFPRLSPQEIVGRTIVYNDSITTKVTGIVENFKKRTDLVFEEFISLPTAAQTYVKSTVNNENWNSTNSNSQLFIKLGENANSSNVQKQLDHLAEIHTSEDLLAYGMRRKFHLQPLYDLHFNTDYGVFDTSKRQASKSVLISLAFVALFLLLLGCINFINLNTAQATQRAKEIGIRKTLGGSKKQLISQFLGETLLLTLMAAALSVILAAWLLNVFSDFIPQNLDLDLLLNPWVLSETILLLLMVSLLSGFYPALVLSHFKPVSVLKNQVFKGSDNTSLRKFLIVFQFAIAQVFIIATLLVGKQIQFMMTLDMGFKTESIAYIGTPYQEPARKKQLFVQQLKTIPQIDQISLGWAPPASNYVNSTIVDFIDDDKKINTTIKLLFGDSNYLDLYNIPLLAGRKKLNDTIKEFVINETLLETLGFENPREAIGKSLLLNNEPYPIVGVMADFNQRSLKSKIEPMALIGDWHAAPGRSQFSYVHFSIQNQNGENWSSIIAKVEDSWNEIYPETDFQLEFMDETVAKFYERERSMNHLLNWATGLSILISCLGLLGLVIYTTERRRKEIGIRKILGASIVQINLLLSKDFLVLVGLAFVIAAPIAWYAMNKWLQDFAYKTNLSWWIFILSGLGMLFIAIIIMSIKTIKTAMANPVRSLRDE